MMKADCAGMAEELQNMKHKKEQASQLVQELEGQIQQLQNALLQRDKQVKVTTSSVCTIR